MSLYSLLDGMDNDPIFGSHMRTMRQMNSMMSSFFSNPMLMGPPALEFGGGGALSPFPGFPLANINRLLSGSLNSLEGAHPHGHVHGHPYGQHAHTYSSSTVVSMSAGPDGRPQVYKATSSSRSAPGGVREVQKTVSDSRTGTKTMSIGHHIGDRAHIIEREQNVRSGDQEERQDFINLDEDEADDFNREWETRTRNRANLPRITEALRSPQRFPTYAERHGHGGAPYGNDLLAITAGPSSRQGKDTASAVVAPRKSVRDGKSSRRLNSSARRPYSPPGSSHSHPKKNKNIKTVSGSAPSPDM